MKIKVKGDNIEMMYNMIPYKSKVMHVEDDIIILSPIINNRNAYPRKENNCGDDYCMILIDDENLGRNIIDGNTDLSGNIILERGYLVLSYLLDSFI